MLTSMILRLGRCSRRARTANAVFAATGMAAALLAALACAPASAATISGRVPAGAGMTVIALTSDGTAVRQKLRGGGRFSLAVTGARGATLQLLRKNGSYYGPVVLAARRRVGYAALSGRSTRVGDLVLARGYARARKPVRAADLDRRRRVVLDRRGAPVGAGRHGLVKLSTTRRGVARAAATGQPGASPLDADRDGLPGALDLDANGNGVLDSYDASARPSGAGFFSTLYADMRNALNVDATPSLGRSTIDAFMSGDNTFSLIFYFSGGQFAGRQITGAHVDCGALSYCRRKDGTAVVTSLADAPVGTFPSGQPWASFSPDGSGLPNLARLQQHGGGGEVWAMPFAPHATSAQIRPGDTYDVVFGSAQGAIHVPTALTAYFVTTPAIAAWGSGTAGNRVAYPLSDGAPGTSEGTPFVLESGQLALQVWRPQRQAIPGAETGTFIDQGRLHYGIVLTTADGSREFGCSGHYSGLSETLQAHAATSDPATQLTPLVDSAADAAPDPARTVGMTVDLAACLRAQGVDPAGQTVRATLTAAGESRPGGMDRGAQMFHVRLPSA